MSDYLIPPSRDATPGIDLSLCEREPIHIPGAIQPHGAVIAVLAEGLRVTHASANLAAVLGRPAEAVLGLPLTEVVGEVACLKLLSARSRHSGTLGQAQSLSGADGGSVHLNAHRSGHHICVDIEPLPSEPWQTPPVTMAQSILETFKHATRADELCELAVLGLKTITGYDRVMAYRFADDGHGEVIAEAREEPLEPYLGLHYPAGDIPPQARRQYLLQRVGAIADSSYRPVPLLADPALAGDTPLDLTRSALRSVSPVHREYMRNMKTAASLTIGLARGEVLWGMLVCHHTTPRIAGPDLRAFADMVGQVVSLLLASLAETDLYARQHHRQATLRALADRLAAPMPLPEALAADQAELLHLVDAAGAVVRLSGRRLCLGRTPPPSATEPALRILFARANGDVLAIDDLGLRHPELADCTSDGSGALLLPLAPGTDDAILWFRPEHARMVTWGGNPAAHAAVEPLSGRLSPRTSFAAWKQTVHGCSLPWADADLALARELRSTIAAQVALCTKAELARLRHYDPLTGLPNRGLLQDWLAEARRDAGIQTALLFLDLDRFKAVNDTMGHAAGDALLIEAARRLLAVTGPRNLAARLGGDEFVVLCRGLDQAAAGALGERIRQAIEAPFEIAGRTCHISASIGIATADRTGGLDLVRAADMAMYVAKQHGGNRGLMFEPSLYKMATEQFELDHDLREAPGHDDQLYLVYQPLFRIVSGTRHLFGFEALARWRHPGRGEIAPDVFIPLAEKSGIILRLGEWVLRSALRQGRAFLKLRPEAGLRLSVNVTASQLAEPNFCRTLADMLRTEDFPPAALCLEVTESTLANVAVAYVLAGVRKLGVHVSIDDFGMGYSSLSYLWRLPADEVKLDRSFLRDVDGEARGAGFVGAVIALAHAAGMSVVLEGIETQSHFDLALATGADIVQGYLFARPLAATAALELLAEASVIPLINQSTRSDPLIGKDNLAAGHRIVAA